MLDTHFRESLTEPIVTLIIMPKKLKTSSVMMSLAQLPYGIGEHLLNKSAKAYGDLPPRSYRSV